MELTELLGRINPKRKQIPGYNRQNLVTKKKRAKGRPHVKKKQDIEKRGLKLSLDIFLEHHLVRSLHELCAFKSHNGTLWLLVLFNYYHFLVTGNLKNGFDNRFMQVLNFDTLQGTFTLSII